MSSMREARTSDPFSEISEMVHEQSHRIFLGAAVFWILHRNYGGDVDQWERAESDLFEKLELSELTGFGNAEFPLSAFP